MSHAAPAFEVRQEDDVVAVRKVVRVVIVSVLVAVVGVTFAGWLVVQGAGALRVRGPEGPLPPLAEISRVEQTPIRDTRRGIDLRAAQERELARWGWVDRRAGIAVIPIERAIDVVAGESR